MNAFQPHKTIKVSFSALLAALVLALGLSAAPLSAAYAEEVGAVEFTYESPRTSNQDMIELRQLLSQPSLSDAQRLRLERSLEDMGEEMADASDAIQAKPKGIVDTVNTLLGIKTPTDSAQS
ncbi:hypothetical protein ACFL12_04130 [Pseudomonadota bacterium]